MRGLCCVLLLGGLLEVHGEGWARSGKCFVYICVYFLVLGCLFIHVSVTRVLPFFNCHDISK